MSARRLALPVLLLALPVPAAAAPVMVRVDATAGVHAISPLIYGMNYATAEQVQAGGIALTRWGGNRTTRYNYQIDVSNTGNDYFFENIPGCWGDAGHYCSPVPKDPMGQSGANAFLAAAAGLGVTALFTVPTIGWVAKAPPVYAHPFVCGFPKSFSASQDRFDPYDANCGNGQRGGQDLAPPPPATTSTAADPAFMGAWVSYLRGKFGPGAGHRIYALDNEPNLWSSTHRDLRTTRLSYDELWQRMSAYAAAILAADPGAEIAGPAEWGWPNYLCSDADIIAKGCSDKSPDRASHGGEELVAWLLDQARAYEQQHGQRIWHYLDLHYYPQGGNSPENTRSLWDPTYTDPSWINAQIALVPRMRAWTSQHYPGTRTLISEYDFGNHDTAAGAVTYAEVLGIFGREGLDAATAWSPPQTTERAFAAYRLYRNYDGHGSGFASTSVQATVSGDPPGGAVRAYAAVDAGRATVVLVNEGAAAVDVAVALAGFRASGAAGWFTAAGSGSAITAQPEVPVAGEQATVQLGGMSFGMLVVPGTAPALPDLAVPAATDGGASPATDLAMGPAHPGGCGCHAGGAPGERPPGGGAALAGLLLWLLFWGRRSLLY